MSVSQASAVNLRGGGDYSMRRCRKLSDEISINELLELRQEDLSNKQIADRLGVSPTTIYRYIGKRSMAVRKAEEQNKPCPISPKTEIQPVRQERNGEWTAMKKYERDQSPKSSALRVIRESHVLDLQGSFCVFHIDTSTKTVELKDDANGTLVGLMNMDDLPQFIEELKSVNEMISERASA